MTERLERSTAGAASSVDSESRSPSQVGRPKLCGTTKEFLRAFGVSRIDDLPNPGASSGGTPD